eukprot:Hpha_TRINITY_DN21763_c0_g1::TRINITY_DN21763_c0_g1_i1::g.194176::m.194176
MEGVSRALRCVGRGWRESKPYAMQDTGFTPLYRASCHCGDVKYEVSAEPLDAKLCHCRACQKLHGAPFEWVQIFEKDKVRFTSGTDKLYFWSDQFERGFTAHEREEAEEGRFELPVKVSCCKCRTPIADEGRNMWLAYGTLFDFKDQKVPDSFKHQCHLFYAARVIDMPDDKPKWLGHKNKSPLFE